MKAPLSWLKDFVDIDIDVKEFCNVMTLTGTKVEAYTNASDGISNVVAGRITQLEKHSNSDHLLIAQVDIGQSSLQIVTGAPNVEVGQIVPVALHGARLAKDLVIKKGKLRGELSEGMMCSIQELGLTHNDYPDAAQDGIWILKPDTELGMDIVKYAGMDDTVIEFEITPNRPDCYSIKGIAREAAAALCKPFKEETVVLKQEGPKNASDYIDVAIEAPDLCQRYCARIVTDVKIEASPDWMRQKLRNAGIRPINNIVDITNYVLLEMGQPMHAFDLSYISNNKIIVRRAQDGEKIISLDEQEHTLDSSMLVIADDSKPVAIAGIMGAQNSEVKQDTVTVLFESANFLASNVRISAKKLGMRTDSSALFEKGLDPHNAMLAIDRACELVEIIGAGKVVAGVVDVGAELSHDNQIKLDSNRINALLGTDISIEKMRTILTNLKLAVSEKDIVSIPSFRSDLKTVTDLAEEIARFYGYNNIAPTLSLGKAATQGGLSHTQKVRKLVKDVLGANGLYETMTFSFISPKDIQALQSKDESLLSNAMRIKNPLGEDFSIMRTSVVPSMMKVLSHNINRNNEIGRFFEISHTYHSLNGSHEEREAVTAAIYGDCDFYTIKGIVENILDVLGIKKVKYVPYKQNTIYHPGRCAHIILNDQILGTIGQAAYALSEQFDAPKDSYLMELSFDLLAQNADFNRVYEALPRYPASLRDLSIVVDIKVLSADIIANIHQAAGNILEDVQLFDMYTGEQIGSGLKSLSYSLVFRRKDRTLEDSEVNKAMEKILSILEKEFDAKIR